jgi:hypothetical protein
MIIALAIIAVAAGLSDGRQGVAASDTPANTSAASQNMSATAIPSITSASTTPRAHFSIDGTSYQNHTAGQSYSLTSPDARTLRFEIRPGDRAWYDGKNVDRADIERIPRIASDTPVEITYQFLLEPGAANTASWFVTGEMHNDDEVAGVPTSPPFAIELAGEHLRVVARHCPSGLNPSNRAGNLKLLTLWTDPDPIKRGQYYDIKVQANFTNTTSGSLDVWINGQQVVEYKGPLGYGYPTYWVEGLYRSADSNQIAAANFRNLIITTRAW